MRHSAASTLFSIGVAAAVTLPAIATEAHAELIAQWDFELPVGASVGSALASDTDSVNGLVATGNNGATYGDPAPALGGTASANFGGGAYLSVSDSDLLTGHANGGEGFQSFELDFYVRLNNLVTSGTQQIIRKTGLNGSNGPGFELYAQSNGLIGFSLNDETGTPHRVQESGFLTSADTWYHVVATWDGSFVALTVDGNEVGTPAAYDGPFVNTDIAMGIGALIRSNGSVGQQFDGSVDGLTIRGVVPEPASLSLIGLGSLLMLRRRQCR